MEFDDELVFFEGEIAALEVRAEIVDPAETTALAATEKAGGFGERAPAAFTVSSNVRNEAMIFFFGPCTFVCVSFLTARGPSHTQLITHTIIRVVLCCEIALFFLLTLELCSNKDRNRN